MADKLIGSSVTDRVHRGYGVAFDEEAAHNKAYNGWTKPPDGDYDETALREAKAAVENEMFGMYGNLAKKYCLEDNPAKGARLGKDLAEYLHEVDRRAGEMFVILQDGYLKDERFKHTGDYLEDVRRANQMNDIIRETITNDLVYVD